MVWNMYKISWYLPAISVEEVAGGQLALCPLPPPLTPSIEYLSLMNTTGACLMTTTFSTPVQGDTLTNTEWLRTIWQSAPDAIAVRAYNKLLDLVNNEGYPLDDIRDFIDTYGTKAFVDGHYETWAQITEELGVSNEAVEAFVEEFGIYSIGGFESSYRGKWGSGEEFARDYVENTCNIDNIPGFIEIDWEAIWENLSDDYAEVDGYIFNKHF